MKLKTALLSVSGALLLAGCGGKPEVEKSKMSDAEYTAYKKNVDELETLNNQYRDIPDEKILDNDGQNSPLYLELKARYKDYLSQMKQAVEATGAKFVVVIIKPIEKADNAVLNFKVGRPFIVNSCKEMGIDCYDFSSQIDAQDPKVITLLPRDGHWSKKGAEFYADLLEPVMKKYTGVKSTATFKPTERTETFGDLPPNDDEILDGGKDMPYRIKANVQGVRMDHDLKFPKTKQRIVFMGSSHIYSPFLDNEFIATSILQKKMPEVEIMNVGSLSASIDDHVTLFKEKTKYAEPDVVVMQTNGGDIIHLYFTNRNHLSRDHKPHNPTTLEEKYYKTTHLQ